MIVKALSPPGGRTFSGKPRESSGPTGAIPAARDELRALLWGQAERCSKIMNPDRVQPRSNKVHMPTSMLTAALLLSGVLTSHLPSAPADSRRSRPEDNLLSNSGAEKGSRTPREWDRTQPVTGVEYLWDKKTGFESKRSLSLKKTVERYFPIASWRQEISLDEVGRRLHVGAMIKAERAHKAVLDVEFELDDGEFRHQWASYVGARETGDPPAQHDWQWYSGIVEVPEGAKRAFVGLQMYGPGQVWFDEVTAHSVADDTLVTKAAQLQGRPASDRGRLPVAGTRTTPQSGGNPFPATSRAIDSDDAKRYFLIPPRQKKAPEQGYRLLLVVPGGDGSADFHPFIRRIAENSLPASYLVVQAVAPVWSDDENRVVWPTRKLPDRKMKFATEEFLEEILEAAMNEYPIDSRHVYALGWSSGGPPSYTASLQKSSKLTGCLVAMSVFKPELLPSLKHARGKAYYLLHSPEDFISMSFPETAVKKLKKAGAEVHLEQYDGGHGWHGDVYGHIRKGIQWLEKQSN